MTLPGPFGGPGVFSTMANLVDPQGQDLTDKVVVLSSKDYRGDQEARRFLCRSGFGCKPHSRGNAIYGEFVSDEEQTRVERWQVEFVELDGEAS